MGIAVNFNELEQQHPSYTGIMYLIGGEIARQIVTKSLNTCATQLSYALNTAGAPIRDYAYEDAGLPGGKVRALPDDAGRNYVYSVIDLRVYLDRRYGPAENVHGDGPAKTAAAARQQLTRPIAGRKGIIAFGNTHIDLWDGDRFHWEGSSIPPNVWLHESVRLRGIFFWPVTGRESRNGFSSPGPADVITASSSPARLRTGPSGRACGAAGGSPGPCRTRREV